MTEKRGRRGEQQEGGREDQNIETSKFKRFLILIVRELIRWNRMKEKNDPFWILRQELWHCPWGLFPSSLAPVTQ